MITEFKLSEKEIEEAKNFEKNHLHSKVYKGAIGGHIIYSFTPTGLGNAIIMKCSICGKTKNITDYTTW